MVLTGDVIVDIKTLIETAKEHAELLQEMMLAADENDARTTPALLTHLPSWHCCKKDPLARGQGLANCC